MKTIDGNPDNDAGLPPAAPPMGWYLMHHDQMRHGPFAWKRIVQGAKSGKLHPLSQLMHPERTAGKWMPVTTIPALSSLLDEIPAPTTLPQSSSPVATAVSKKSPASSPVHVHTAARRRGGGWGQWLSSVAMFILPTCVVLGLVAYRIGSDRLMTILGRPAHPIGKPLVRPQPPTSLTPIETSLTPALPTAPDRAAAAPSQAFQRQANPSRTDASDAADQPVNSSGVQQAKRLDAFGHLGDGSSGLRSRSDNPVAIASARVPMDLSRSTSRIDMPAELLSMGFNSDESASQSVPMVFRVASVGGLLGDLLMEPASGEFGVGDPVTIQSSALPTFRLHVKLVESNQPATGDETPAADRSVIFETSFAPNGGKRGPCSLDRIDRAITLAEKNLTGLGNQAATLIRERTERQAFIDSVQVKRLDAVNFAKNRVRVIETLQAGLLNQITAAQGLVIALQRFREQAKRIDQADGVLIQRLGPPR